MRTSKFLLMSRQQELLGDQLEVRVALSLEKRLALKEIVHPLRRSGLLPKLSA
jgi:hypothetical protein